MCRVIDMAILPTFGEQNVEQASLPDFMNARLRNNYVRRGSRTRVMVSGK